MATRKNNKVDKRLICHTTKCQNGHVEKWPSDKAATQTNCDVVVTKLARDKSTIRLNCQSAK